MKKVIETYNNIPGEHCGSVAMSNLLSYYTGLRLPEDVVFGLGAGLDFFMLPTPGSIPMLSGRSVSLESDTADHLGISYREEFEMDNNKAWELVRAEILEERPVMLTGDIYYLDYRKFKVHFPAHRFVLVGFDDDQEEAYIMDRIKPEYETCSLEALSKSRNPIGSITTFNLWGKFPDGSQSKASDINLEEACRAALQTCALRMLGLQKNSSLLMQGLDFQFQLKTGIAGLEALHDEITMWSQAENADKIADFNANCIEKFGTGGGLFRNLYTGFLQWARDHFPMLVSENDIVLARRSAGLWTALAEILWQLAGTDQNEESKAKAWKKASKMAVEIANVEKALFTSLLNQ